MPKLKNTDPEVPEAIILPEEQSAPQESPKTVSSVAQEIPAEVKKVLRLYPNYPSLYIDKKNGTFPPSTPSHLVKDAVLYQNPYYSNPS